MYLLMIVWNYRRTKDEEPDILYHNLGQNIKNQILGFRLPICTLLVSLGLYRHKYNYFQLQAYDLANCGSANQTY